MCARVHACVLVYIIVGVAPLSIVCIYRVLVLFCFAECHVFVVVNDNGSQALNFFPSIVPNTRVIVRHEPLGP